MQVKPILKTKIEVLYKEATGNDIHITVKQRTAKRMLAALQPLKELVEITRICKALRDESRALDDKYMYDSYLNQLEKECLDQWWKLLNDFRTALNS